MAVFCRLWSSEGEEEEDHDSVCQLFTRRAHRQKDHLAGRLARRSMSSTVIIIFSRPDNNRQSSALKPTPYSSPCIGLWTKRRVHAHFDRPFSSP